jgi:hypothetical protein
MSFLTDLFPQPGELKRPEADAILFALRTALATGTADGLPGWALPLADRMRQAEAKIAAGEPVKRMAELIALAQFGAGSLGRAVAEASGSSAEAPACESLYVAEFLASVASPRSASPHLVPPDPGSGDPAAARAAILGRADQALASAAAPGTDPALSRFRKRRAAFCARRIARLRRGHPTGAPGLWDRAAVALSLAFGR